MKNSVMDMQRREAAGRRDQAERADWARGFQLALDDIRPCADAQDWPRVSAFVRGIVNVRLRDNVEAVVIQEHPDYVPHWPEADCAAYLRLYSEPFPLIPISQQTRTDLPVRLAEEEQPF